MYGFSALLSSQQYTFMTEGKSEICLSNPGKYLCFNNMINKFVEDRIFCDDDEFMIVLDGIVLNKNKLIDHKIDWKTFFITSLKANGFDFIESLRGSFSGIVYDKRTDEYTIFSDHIGSRFIYYIQQDTTLFVSSQIRECYAFLKQNNINYHLVTANAYLLLTYGYMLEDHTLCDKIKKIEPGCYLKFKKGKLKQIQYSMLDNTPDMSISKEDAMELMDSEFRRVISMEFEKDDEYGYRHVVALSGGLDSRMVSWVAHDMGYNNQLNMTFSQSGYFDQTIPQQIASDLKHDWIFKSLDGGWWLQDVDKITVLTGGNVLYPGQAHGYSFESIVDFSSDLGIIHSGQIGDVAFSSPYGNKYRNPYDFGAGAYSLKLLHKLEGSLVLHADYPNREMAQLYYRSFGANYYSFNIEYNMTEAYSPFQDIDLLANMFKIPVEIRQNYKLYFDWILKKYPDSANYIWEKTRAKITRKWGFVSINGNKVKIETIPQRILHKIGLVRAYGGITSKNNMNPYAYYINSNPVLKLWIDNYFKNNIDRVNDVELKDDILTIWKGNDIMLKLQAISLLSAIKIFF